MTPKQALAVLQEDNVVTVRPDGWFYIHQRPAVRDLARFVLAIKSLGAWSVETTLGKAKVRVTTGGIDARDGIMFKIEEDAVSRVPAPPFPYKYTPLYRPPGFATVPDGWVLVERPRMSCGFDRRTELPLSEHTFGVIAYSKPLTEDEIRQYQLMPV